MRELIAPILAEAAVSLTSLTYKKRDNRYYLEILLDKEEGRIDVDVCSSIAEKISQALDDVPFLQDEYILEVASAGTDRPLVSRADYARALKSEAHIITREPVRGYREFYGELTAVDDDGVTLLCRDKNKIIAVTIAFSNIEEAETSARA